MPEEKKKFSLEQLNPDGVGQTGKKKE